VAAMDYMLRSALANSKRRCFEVGKALHVLPFVQGHWHEAAAAEPAASMHRCGARSAKSVG
jgi:hypothetical protein